MTVKLTNLTAVDSYYRMLNDVRNRISKLNFQADVQGLNAQCVQDIGLLERIEICLLDIQYTTPNSWRLRKLGRAFRSFGSTEEHVRHVFGDCVFPSSRRYYAPGEKQLLERLRKASKAARVRAYRSRIYLEILKRHYDGWYLIFNTLTVDEANYEKVFYEDKRAFEKYIAAFKRKVRIAAFGSPSTKGCAEYHSYFAVVERGKERGRLHIHVLHFCKALPKGCVDPNYGKPIPDNRVIDALRSCWPHGFSEPIAVRFSGNDNFGRLGWRWPVEWKNGKPLAIEASSGIKMAAYVSKYITKSYYEREWKWRTRMSQRFGTKIIEMAIRKLSKDVLINHLCQVTRYEHLTIMDVKLPSDQVQKVATREMLRRLSTERSTALLGSKRSIWKSAENGSEKILKQLSELKPQPNIVMQYRDLIRKTTICRRLKSGDLVTQKSKKTVIFEARVAFENEMVAHGHGPHVVGRGPLLENVR